MEVDYAEFTNRDARADYTAHKLGEYLKGRLLDVGCDTRRLKSLVPGLAQYTGVDIGGEPDLVLNLEKIERLPFNERSFDCVVCTDVLEHLDNLHRTFGELVRVTNRHLIISLPNCWRNLRRRITRGEGTPRYYGLPVEQPEDRHKWFFNAFDVVAFMKGQERVHPVTVVKTFMNIKPALPLVRALRRVVNPRPQAYLNRYAHTVWTVLERR